MEQLGGGGRVKGQKSRACNFYTHAAQELGALFESLTEETFANTDDNR